MSDKFPTYDEFLEKDFRNKEEFLEEYRKRFPQSYSEELRPQIEEDAWQMWKDMKETYEMKKKLKDIIGKEQSETRGEKEKESKGKYPLYDEFLEKDFRNKEEFLKEYRKRFPSQYSEEMRPAMEEDAWQMWKDMKEKYEAKKKDWYSGEYDKQLRQYKRWERDSSWSKNWEEVERDVELQKARLAKAIMRKDEQEVRAALQNEFLRPHLNETVRVGKVELNLLALACFKGTPDIVTLLLRAGANPNQRDNKGTPLLIFVVYNASKRHQRIMRDVVSALLRGGADPNIRDANTKITPLMVCAENGNKELADLLISQGADLSLEDAAGETAAYKAFKNHNFLLYRYLIDQEYAKRKEWIEEMSRFWQHIKEKEEQQMKKKPSSTTTKTTKSPSVARSPSGRKGIRKEERIVHRDDGYYVLSEKGNRNLGGPYKSKEQAKKRLQQIHYFEHKKSGGLVWRPTSSLEKDNDLENLFAVSYGPEAVSLVVGDLEGNRIPSPKRDFSKRDLRIRPEI